MLKSERKINFSTPFQFLFIVSILFLFSCKKDKLDVDVSHINIELKLERFDQNLFDFSKEIGSPYVEELLNSYGIFFEHFTERVINIGNIKNPQVSHHLNSFCNDSNINQIKDDVDKIYLDFSLFFEELEDAFRLYKYYFPNEQIPRIITYISGFNYAIVTDKEYLGVGLDMFLGKDYEAYTQMRLPKYKTASMTQEHVVSSAIHGWISTEFEINHNDANLLEEIVYQGKMLYLMDALLRNTPDHIKINYSLDQLEWCEDNAEPIWFYFIDNNLLYTKENTEITKYLGEAPFTQGFPEGSPGRIGHWLGWQIVKAYMKKNSEVSLIKLISESNAQSILDKSKYKP